MKVTPVDEQLVRHVDRSGGPDACWPWLLRKNRGGYGVVYHDSRESKAHRLAWERANGPVPGDLCVLHDCDNRPCCNPKHLWLGTRADNIADMHAKGRNRNLAGAEHSLARFSKGDVAEMRRLYAAGATQQEIADDFKTAQAYVSRLLRYHWSDVVN